MKNFAVIFDMDGTLVDNTPYHYRTWQVMFEKYGMGELPVQTYYAEFSGVPVFDTVQRIFSDRDSVGLHQLVNEKETIYQRLYTPHAAPIKGLIAFLDELKQNGIKIAIASSASIHDIDFVLDRIHVRDYFDVIIDGSQVSKGKPNPEIFLKAAAHLQTPPEHCAVIEDSIAGIKAGNGAGMKVIGITTGNTAEKLQPSAMVINDFTALSVKKLAALFN
ncbi:HAD family hydrolase [Mucilaginibacter calamicampi]|uniref:Beta-phosphoglucomutase n=1 Tax=Mucilaginibacter calamicampi TaxID=1302352 RepID=A0ABW2YTG5_9SPHI